MLGTKSVRTITKQTTTKSQSRDTPITPLRRVIIPRPDILHTYLEYKHINQYMEYLSNRYPHFVHMYTLGHTHEKREIRALEINWMNSQNVELSTQMREQSPPPFVAGNAGHDALPVVHNASHSRNTVFIEAGTHAREWISISTALNCIYQLTERYTRNIDVLRKLRFIIVPLVNPDGYEYSRTKNMHYEYPSSLRIPTGARTDEPTSPPSSWAPTVTVTTIYSGPAVLARSTGTPTRAIVPSLNWRLGLCATYWTGSAPTCCSSSRCTRMARASCIPGVIAVTLRNIGASLAHWPTPDGVPSSLTTAGSTGQVASVA
ncbi:uncharacterized protein [Drosophila kikkawai]|uniref:Uncharacterized protein isoform X2 n=1 Tax=Drosophila kikkawai TaxID=30033 RepID=A0A6P4IXS2_DROKI|nr:uncharacterized protein LOC108078050 isoform X2 [Drosophila kikkawai]